MARSKEKIKTRMFETALGTTVIAGKDEESNELVVGQAKSQELLIHTAAPGSPFCNIKSDSPTQEDIYETAVFCAKYSKDWKQAKRKKDILVHVFFARDTKKESGMKKGCFAVSKFKELKVKKQDILEFEKDLECAMSGKNCGDEK